MRGRDQFRRFRGVMRAMEKLWRVFPCGIRIKLLEHFRGTKGRKGLVLRYTLLRAIADIGDNVSIGTDVYLLHPQSIRIGNNVSIQPMSYLEGYGGIEIGSDVSIAHGATLLSVTHRYDDPAVPIRDQELKPLPLKLGSDIWIGAKATLLGGITIGSGCIVGAGAVVTKSVADRTVVAGVPAVPIKER